MHELKYVVRSYMYFMLNAARIWQCFDTNWEWHWCDIDGEDQCDCVGEWHWCDSDGNTGVTEVEAYIFRNSSSFLNRPLILLNQIKPN